MIRYALAALVLSASATAVWQGFVSLPPGTVVALEDAPELDFDPDLPMGGIFYGQGWTGSATGNAQIAIQSSRRFMAERSGEIVAVRHNNRTLSDANVSDRCDADESSLWCKCVAAGLDGKSCGYVFGNSYSVGNGGLITVEVRADDGAGLPAESVLSESESYVPYEIADQHYPVLTLERPVRLEAGKLYHLVYRNDNPPRDCPIKGLRDYSRAASCPRDAGAIGLNGIYFRHLAGPTAKFGPWLGNAGAVLYRSSPTADWSLDPDNLSWYEVRYDDGTWVGDSTIAYRSDDDAQKVVEGATRGRQRFTVEDADRVVNGVWIEHGLTKGASGDPMAVTLDGGGQVLAQGTLVPDAECRAIVQGASSVAEERCRAWGYVDFERDVVLSEGSTYTLELSAPSGAGFVLSTYRGLDWSPYDSKDRNRWTSARAQVSTNDAETWSDWMSYYPQRDLPVLFTISGQPREIR